MMQLRLLASFTCRRSSSTKAPRLSNIPYRLRPKAIQYAKEALIDYLHSTRSIPLSYAEPIAKNASISLSLIISKLPFHPSTFRTSMHRFLRYHPINEFQFFYESIGINFTQVQPRFPLDRFFLSQDHPFFSNACALGDFGFPWNKLGLLCMEKDDIFSNPDTDLRKRLSDFSDRYGFDNAVVVGICLAFPHVLSGFGQIDNLLNDLKRVLLHTGMVNHVERNVDVTYEICRKIRLFYNLGCKKGEVADLLVMNYNIFIAYTEDDLVGKIEFFSRLGVDKEQVGLLLLLKPGIFRFDLEDRVITVLSLLNHFHLSLENLKHIKQNYPHVLGNNRMVNVPHIIRAMDLSEWFFNVIKLGDHILLATYGSSSQIEDTDDDYRNNLQKIMSGRKYVHATSKIDFLLGIGFGENKFIVNVMPKLHGTSSNLYEPFNLLLSLGIKFSKLCKMISLSPKILNQNTHLIERKVQFLCEGMDSSLEYLEECPSFLMYDLENRIKPRYEFYLWLKDQGWCRKEYGVVSMIVTSEKNFIARISCIHPDALKKWYESQKKKRKQVSEKSQSTSINNEVL